MKIKIERILFWLLIALLIGLAIWKLFGSPTDTASIIAVALFAAGSEILIWRALFNIDKKTSMGFMRLSNDMNNKFSRITNKLENIERMIAKRKWQK